jgi:hypothetical protein
MEKARKIYNEMILDKSDIGKITSSIWIEFYDLERKFGDEKHQRKLLNRALSELTDQNEKEIIFDSLFKFEKLNGNTNQFSNVYFKYEQFKLLKNQEQAERLSKSMQVAQQKSNGATIDQNKKGGAQQRGKQNGADFKGKSFDEFQKSKQQNNLKRKVREK